MKLFADSIWYHCHIHQSEPGLPWLLMMHGFMGSSRIFEPLLDRLFSFCNPISIDLAGHGHTKTPPDTALFSAERQAGQIASIIRRLQIKNLHLYGYSMGGRVVFQVIARFPERFKSAVIESAHCGIHSSIKQQERQSLDKQRAQNLEADFPAFLKQWQVMPLFRNTPQKMKNHYSEIMATQNPALMAASLRGFGSGVMPSVCQQLSKSTTPIQLIAGKQDTNYVNRMDDIARLNPLFSFDVIEDAGHRVHADQPEQWAEVIRRALERYIR